MDLSKSLIYITIFYPMIYKLADSYISKLLGDYFALWQLSSLNAGNYSL